MAFHNITTAVEKLIATGLTAKEISKNSGAYLVPDTDDSGRKIWLVSGNAELGKFSAYRESVEAIAAPAAAPVPEAPAARVSNARAARYSSQYDPAGYGEVMGARVTHRDNRAGFTTYDGNTQIWD